MDYQSADNWEKVMGTLLDQVLDYLKGIVMGQKLENPLGCLKEKMKVQKLAIPMDSSMVLQKVVVMVYAWA